MTPGVTGVPLRCLATLVLVTLTLLPSIASEYENTIVETPTMIAEVLVERFEATGSRGGFMIGRSVAVMSDLAAVVGLLLPELQRQGRFQTGYRGRTLREHLAER